MQKCNHSVRSSIICVSYIDRTKQERPGFLQPNSTYSLLTSFLTIRTYFTMQQHSKADAESHLTMENEPIAHDTEEERCT